MVSINLLSASYRGNLVATFPILTPLRSMLIDSERGWGYLSVALYVCKM